MFTSCLYSTLSLSSLDLPLTSSHTHSNPTCYATTSNSPPTSSHSPYRNLHDTIVSNNSTSSSSPDTTSTYNMPLVSIPFTLPMSSSSPCSSSSSSIPCPLPPMSTHSMQTRSKSGIFKPKTFLTITSILYLHSEPSSVSIALADPKWK